MLTMLPQHCMISHMVL